ncbi:hypothetical protein HAX54_026113, partial [Datura stramonium]|nr:hypothetical protein [Datura stramonium]
AIGHWPKNPPPDCKKCLSPPWNLMLGYFYAHLPYIFPRLKVREVEKKVWGLWLAPRT